MKQTFTLLAFLLFSISSQAQVKYISYGEGWSIPINSDIPFDVNEDGRVDFHINRHENELGFSPEFIIGCIASPSETAYVSFGAREMTIFEKGDVINGEDLDFDTFIDDLRGSNWHSEEGFAAGWNDGEEQYIGFILLREENGPIMASNGWMKIKVDAQNEALVILELAYEEQLNEPIITGAISTSTENVVELKTLTIAPNPASDLINVSFDYEGSQPLNAAVYNDLGQKMIDLDTFKNKGKKSIKVDVRDLNNGAYYLLLSNGTIMKTERFTVIR